MTIEAMRDVDVEVRRRDRVVIAAAVAYLFGPSAVVRSVRAVSGRRAGAWTREGRLAIRQHGMSQERAGRSL